MAHNLRIRILPDKGFAVNYKQKYDYSYLINSRPNYHKMFQKMQKILFWAHFRPTLSIFGQNRIFFKILFLPAFLILSIIVPHFKKD